jgi:hypothetical protein
MESTTQAKFYFTYTKVTVFVNNQKILTITEDAMSVAEMTLAQFRDKYLKEPSQKVSLQFRGQRGEILSEEEQHILTESVMIMANGFQGGKNLR